MGRALVAGAGQSQPPTRRKPTDIEIEFAWNRCDVVEGFDTWLWRLDVDGRVMKRTEYGKTTDYGWEVDHILPLSQGGADTLLNMRARHYIGNRRAGGLLTGN